MALSFICCVILGKSHNGIMLQFPYLGIMIKIKSNYGDDGNNANDDKNNNVDNGNAYPWGCHDIELKEWSWQVIFLVT